MQFRLMSPGTGAYRVQLSQVSGEETAEAVLAGEDDEMRVELPPGEYWGRVVELGQSTEGRSRFKLQLLSTEPEVRLPYDWREALVPSSRSRGVEPTIRSTRLPRATQLTKLRSSESQGPTRREPIALPQSPAIQSFDLSRRIPGLFSELRGGNGSRFALDTVFGIEQEVPETFNWIGLRASADRVPFSIGISEDRSPGKKGSWTRPSLIRIFAHSIDDGICIDCQQLQDRVPEGGYRVRITLAIAGVPAIRVPVPIYADGTFVQVRPVQIGNQIDFAVEINAFSERVQALVAAVTELPGEEALKILRWSTEAQVEQAIEILSEKRRDLWAATAAALLLVKTRQLEGVEHWLLNLSRFAPHIADASIAGAWARAAQDIGGRRRTERSVMELLNQGLSVGAPTFSLGNSLALEMLNALRNTAQDQDVQAAARDAYVRLTRRSRHKIYRGPYMLWEQSGSRLQSGRLPGPRYQELVRGEM